MGVLHEVSTMINWPFDTVVEVVYALGRQNIQRTDLNIPLPLLSRASPALSLLIAGGAYIGASALTQGHSQETKVASVALLYMLGMLLNANPIQRVGYNATGGGFHQTRVLIAAAIAGAAFPPV